jgi:hypothetical protein
MGFDKVKGEGFVKLSLDADPRKQMVSGYYLFCRLS